MERILTAEQMRSADKYTIDKLGVSQDELVFRAGTAVAEEITKRFYGGRVLVCIGDGNNGADGNVVAEILSKKHGFSVNKLKISSGIIKPFENKYDIIVDCVFGTGLNRKVEGKYKQAIELINKSGAFVVACDIPSGLCGNTGKVLGVAVKANLTIAIQELKTGYFLNDGLDYCGEVICKDIGISIWGDDFVKRLNSDSVKKFFQKSNRLVNKGNFGKSCLIGGSKKYSGSIILSSLAIATFKMGVGYVNVVVPECMFSDYVGKTPECILTPIKDKDGIIELDENTIDTILNYDTITIGMGCGISKGVYNSIKYILNNYKGTLIIDADGLNCLSKFGIDVLKDKSCKVVLTPHVKEFSRLSKIETNKINENPINIAVDFARHYEVVLLLKNAVSIITDGNETFINTTGCPGMAKAGSGDVLSGIIAGLVARNNENELTETVAGASYVFGIAGEIAQKRQNQFCMTATDIISELAPAINSIN